jgi:hypothetical protein
MESLKLMSTEEALKQWGCWVRSGRHLPMLTDTQRRTPGASTDLTDEEAMAVDSVVAQLKFRDPEMGKAVFSYHAACLDLRRIGQVLDVGETKARQLLKAGEAWVDAAIQYSGKK